MHPRERDDPSWIAQRRRTGDRQCARRCAVPRRREVLVIGDAEQDVDDGVEQGGVAESVVVVDGHVFAAEDDTELV